MKGKLIVLCVVFVGLSVVCLSSDGYNSGMLGALIVALILLIQYAVMGHSGKRIAKERELSIHNEPAETINVLQQPGVKNTRRNKH